MNITGMSHNVDRCTQICLVRVFEIGIETLTLATEPADLGTIPSNLKKFKLKLLAWANDDFMKIRKSICLF